MVETEQMDGVNELKVIGNPELAVALADTIPPTLIAAKAAKVICCGRL